MKDIEYYIMIRHCWNNASKRYDGIDKITKGLTLDEVRIRIRLLPYEKRKLWKIMHYKEDANGFPELVESINADHFEVEGD